MMVLEEQELPTVALRFGCIVYMRQGLLKAKALAIASASDHSFVVLDQWKHSDLRLLCGNRRTDFRKIQFSIFPNIMYYFEQIFP